MFVFGHIWWVIFAQLLFFTPFSPVWPRGCNDLNLGRQLPRRWRAQLKRLRRSRGQSSPRSWKAVWGTLQGPRVRFQLPRLCRRCGLSEGGTGDIHNGGVNNIYNNIYNANYNNPLWPSCWTPGRFRWDIWGIRQRLCSQFQHLLWTCMWWQLVIDQLSSHTGPK